ncbi:MAG: hypothetical protein ACT4NP_08645 [Pseudonocardiales bacterium]
MVTQLPGLGGSAACRPVGADEDAGAGCRGRDQLERAGLTVVGEHSLAAAEGGMDRERPDVRATASLEITVNLPVLLCSMTSTALPSVVKCVVSGEVGEHV